MNTTTTIFHTIQEDKKDRIEVEVGDSKQESFFPQVKIKRFDNEVNFSMRYQCEHVNDVNMENKDGKIVWKNGKDEAHMYEVEDGYELEAILNERPKEDFVTFTIRTKGLDFFYQGEITDKNMIRPENVIGSYAVYMKKRKRNYEHGKKYGCGKVGHIYRPKIIDANGNEIWGTMNIDEEKEILTIHIGKEFLDQATYPVRVDPTFGYNALGGTDYIFGDESAALAFLAGTYTAISGDVLESVSFYARKYAASETIDVGVYRLQSGLPTTKLVSSGTTVNNTVLEVFTVSMGSTSLTAGHEYCVALGGFGGDESASVYNTLIPMDSGSGNEVSRRESTEQDLPNNWDHNSYSAYLPSLWATYSAAPVSVNYSYTIFIDKSNP